VLSRRCHIAVVAVLAYDRLQVAMAQASSLCLDQQVSRTRRIDHYGVDYQLFIDSIGDRAAAYERSISLEQCRTLSNTWIGNGPCLTLHLDGNHAAPKAPDVPRAMRSHVKSGDSISGPDDHRVSATEPKGRFPIK
jgi:hypothetical protein